MAPSPPYWLATAGVTLLTEREGLMMVETVTGPGEGAVEVPAPGGGWRLM